MPGASVPTHAIAVPDPAAPTHAPGCPGESRPATPVGPSSWGGKRSPGRRCPGAWPVVAGKRWALAAEAWEALCGTGWGDPAPFPACPLPALPPRRPGPSPCVCVAPAPSEPASHSCALSGCSRPGGPQQGQTGAVGGSRRVHIWVDGQGVGGRRDGWADGQVCGERLIVCDREPKD